MTAEENEAVARRYVEMWDNQKWKWDRKTTWDEFLDVWHKDILVHHGGEDLHGIAALQEVFTPVLVAFPDFKGTVDQIFSARDMVALRYAWSGTHSKEYAGIPASGRHVTVTATAIYRITGGRIAEAWVNEDSLGLMRQLGALPL